MPFRILSLKRGLHIDFFASGTFWMGSLHVVIFKVYLTKTNQGQNIRSIVLKGWLNEKFLSQKGSAFEALGGTLLPKLVLSASAPSPPLHPGGC